MNEELPIWTIYWNPSDYPKKYVVRRFLCVPGASDPKADKEPTAVTETLAQARRSVPEGLVRLERAQADDKVIVEVWL